jgi:hypothetical protein
MARIIPAPATGTTGGALSIQLALPTDSNPTQASGLAVGAGTNTTDTQSSLTVTGRRFYFESRLFWIGASTTAGMGIAFTGTPRLAFLETEATISTGTGNTQTLTHGSTQLTTPFAPTSPSVMTISGNVVPGVLINRGWIDYATSGTYTLSPVYYSGTSSNAYSTRSFRVETWLA